MISTATGGSAARRSAVCCTAAANSSAGCTEENSPKDVAVSAETRSCMYKMSMVRPIPT